MTRHWGQTFFQDAGSITMLHLTQFHDHAMLILILVMSVVRVVIGSLALRKFRGRMYLKHEILETVWTYVPGILLVILGAPSLLLLYIIDDIGAPVLTLKAIGHQWYWSYEYSDLSDIMLDSFMIPTEDLKVGAYRLLETDHRVCLPLDSQTRVVVTSIDVIHSWAVPSLGVKIDAIPGRLNQIIVQPNKYGVLYGICSEICGANHAFMPIVVEVVSSSRLKEWKSLSQMEA